MGETRQTLAGLSHWQIVLWYCLAGVSTAVFAWGVALLVRKYRRGRGGIDVDRPGRRVARAARVAFSHSSLTRRDGLAGLAHALVFYGFVVLFVGTTILAAQDDIARPLFGWDFWRGDFYLGYSLFLDVFGAALVVGLVMLAAKRLGRPARLDYRRVDGGESRYDRRRYVVGDWVFLGTLLFLGVSGFLLESLRIAETNPSFEKWSPAGWLLGQVLRSAGLSGHAAASVHLPLWWLHGVAALAFVSAIPFTKALHMLADPASIATRRLQPGARLPLLPSDLGNDPPGYGVITDLTPAHLLQLDACTKCGKCHAACPATASGEPLSPRDLILDLREHADGALGVRAALGVSPLAHATLDLRQVVPPETVWACMSCMACVEICPVGIEHVPIISGLRRRLVELGDLDAGLQSTLETIYESGNSFGEPARKRPRWVDGLEVPVRDARVEPVELLWFVGDYASLDPRNQRATQALARILQRAGVDFGILHEGEQNAGNDVRRAGEEGLFVHLAERNIELISTCRFDRILTTDPHSYNTLKNEYPDLGGSWDVVHHSELLLELVEAGALAPLGAIPYRVTYHDPCALGRANGVYEPPRQLLAAIGCELVEMPRNRDNSFCCGAGGGRIWMTEQSKAAQSKPAGPRPSESRISEAVSLGGIDRFVVCCPKDVTMYEDAIKTSGHDREIELAELSELVLEAVQLGSARMTA